MIVFDYLCSWIQVHRKTCDLILDTDPKKQKMKIPKSLEVCPKRIIKKRTNKHTQKQFSSKSLVAKTSIHSLLLERK